MQPRGTPTRTERYLVRVAREVAVKSKCQLRNPIAAVHVQQMLQLRG